MNAPDVEVEIFHDNDIVLLPENHAAAYGLAASKTYFPGSQPRLHGLETCFLKPLHSEQASDPSLPLCPLKPRQMQRSTVPLPKSAQSSDRRSLGIALGGRAWVRTAQVDQATTEYLLAALPTLMRPLLR